MKNTVKLFVLAMLLLCFTALTQSSIAQPPPPPPAEKGTDNNQDPSEAPLGDGTLILIIFAAAYYSIYAYKNKSDTLAEPSY
ncbi:MAG: hypothetical protein WCI92_06135 [Bacteroidota bacterium]